MISASDGASGHRMEVVGAVASGSRSLTVNGNQIDSRELFLQTREITIQHGGDVYRLRLTSQNKLILTK